MLPPKSTRDPDFVEEVRGLGADLSVVVAYGQILSNLLIEAPERGSLNVHPSLLPALRGAAPINWAIARGFDTTGVTIMRMVQAMDAGPILAQTMVPIGATETAAVLSRRLSELGAELLADTLARLEQGALREVEQDHEAATFAPKVDRGSARIDWRRSARRVSCLIRAMDEAPGAWSVLRGTPLKLYAPVVVPEADLGELRRVGASPGEVLGGRPQGRACGGLGRRGAPDRRGPAAGSAAHRGRGVAMRPRRARVGDVPLVALARRMAQRVPRLHVVAGDAVIAALPTGGGGCWPWRKPGGAGWRSTCGARSSSAGTPLRGGGVAGGRGGGAWDADRRQRPGRCGACGGGRGCTSSGRTRSGLRRALAVVRSAARRSGPTKSARRELLLGRSITLACTGARTRRERGELGSFWLRVHHPVSSGRQRGRPGRGRGRHASLPGFPCSRSAEWVRPKLADCWTSVPTEVAMAIRAVWEASRSRIGAVAALPPREPPVPAPGRGRAEVMGGYRVRSRYSAA